MYRQDTISSCRHSAECSAVFCIYGMSVRDVNPGFSNNASDCSIATCRYYEGYFSRVMVNPNSYIYSEVSQLDPIIELWNHKELWAEANKCRPK